MQSTSLSAPLPDRLFFTLAAVGMLLNATGLFPPILEPDGALYACIAKTMAQSGDFVNLHAVGSDWLDKPHFPFWVTAGSFLILGVNTFAYKFPALLFTLGSAVYTYRFARLIYPKLVAQVATLVLLTAFHLMLSNSDVRAEPYLTTLVVGAVYHFWRVFTPPLPPPLVSGEGLNHPVAISPSPFFKRRGWGGVNTRSGGVHLLLGSLLTGCALMTKGPFVLVPIGAGLVLHWLLTGQGRELLKPRWYVAVVLSVLFTLPELYCLYAQFDLHPEKVVFGQTGTSGVRFFVWDSQFGRFFNTGPIKGRGNKFFFVHTLLWAFLPWSLPLYVGVGKTVAELLRRRFDAPEYVSLGSGLATFVLFSLSGFQLPHYLNIVFPFYAVLTAQFLCSLRSVSLRWWTIGQTVLGGLLIVLMVAILFIVQPVQLGLALGWIAVMTFALMTLFRRNDLPSLMGRMVGVMLIVAGVLNGVLYPTFMQYQAGMVAARYVNAQMGSAGQSTVLYEPGTGPGTGSFWTYEFYVDGPIRYARTDSALRVAVSQGPQRVFTTAEYADSLTARGFSIRRTAVFPYYHITKLTYPFLNRATRAGTLRPYVLAEVGKTGTESGQTNVR